MGGSFADVFANSFGKLKNYVRGSYQGLTEYDAEDIVQQTALNILGKGEDMDDVEYAASYIYTALRNGAKNFFRKRSREVVQDEIEKVSNESAEDRLMTSELGEYIQDALQMLDEKSRMVFVETEILGTSYKELSARTGEPVGTLLSRKSRAVKKLRIILDQYVNR